MVMELDQEGDGSKLGTAGSGQELHSFVRLPPLESKLPGQLQDR